jgi:DNA topoisomerase III
LATKTRTAAPDSASTPAAAAAPRKKAGAGTAAPGAGKTLIIAEKPSVANDIARVLGGFTKHAEFFESEQYVLSSAVGHLLELIVPEQFEVKRGKWSFAQLPVIPPHFGLRPIEKNEDRLKLLVRLIKRKDVTGLINACDAGREGELIFRYIVQHAQVAKPIQRLWLQSMTPASIREGFAHLRSDDELIPLADAAVCRSEADWLVGINGTRAMTAFNSKTGGFHKTTVGRVQSPTLAILVDREEKIKRFVSRQYFEIHGEFGAQAGVYPGRWFDEAFAKAKEGDPELRAERLWDEARALAIADKCRGKPGVVTEESKPSTQLSPLLYDLTSLQREANGRFGFSAKTTLSIAQSLYERHKALTYPRTDSRALPEDYIGTVQTTLEALAESRYKKPAGQILKAGWVKPNKRIFNNAKISDHFAIIPTPVTPKALSEAEEKIYDLVTKRFMAVFFPPAEYLLTTRITRVEGEPFKTEGKVLVNPGWLAVYGKEIADEDSPTLAPIAANETVNTESVEARAEQTRPPARFNEATLLSAMEGAGKLVDDEELRDAMKERGLGTPATRAGIIEKLIYEEYVVREGRDLRATPKAFSLMTLLKGLDIPELCSPELTGEWEYKLAEMEHGRLARPVFMEEIAAMTRNLVERAKSHENDTVPGDFVTLDAPCPKCGGVVKENYKKFQCQKCDFSLWRILAGRQFEPIEIEELIVAGRIGPLQGFRSRLGRPFAAMIKLNAEFATEFDFGQSSAENSEPVDFSDKTPLGPCPKCGNKVYDTGLAYQCERSVGPERSCDFRSGKIILQREIETEQMVKLLATGKTDLLHKFISKKGRPFSAYLARGGDGKVSFEFEPRVPKTAAKRVAEVAAEKAAAGNAGADAGTDSPRSAGRKAAKKATMPTAAAASAETVAAPVASTRKPTKAAAEAKTAVKTVAKAPGKAGSAAKAPARSSARSRKAA